MRDKKICRVVGCDLEALITGNKPAGPIVGSVRVNSMGPMQWCSRPPVLAAATSGLMPTPCRTKNEDAL